ncbi:RidA family protein [Paenibacillus beijingensis]|uniref:LysR family transcriptional regulator n=1 Tax=Paenibacillus beijingensis TaxID=1126833 RepID=A0A0D5NP45_9BACL|nr:RidA family protein [Paenibacillus beijingensis]AJY76772.1 LysR family transcriptional regulator [Paenibacillus beijingensis]
MIEQRIRELGYELPVAATPTFQYVPVVVHHDLIFVSGQLPKVDGEVKVIGKVGDNVTLEQAQEASRICILQGLSCIKQEIGSLDKISRIVKITGFVNSAPGFNQQPKVIDAASDLLEKIFGEKGRHSRSAIGAAELPRSATVEIEMIVAFQS